MPYLQGGWAQAGNLLQQSKANPYSGPMLAQLTPEQLQNFQNMTGFANNSGTPRFSNNVAAGAQRTAGGLAATGAGLAGAGAGLTNTGTGMLAQGGATTGQGTSAMLDAIHGLGGYSPTGGVDANVSAAQQYADNPALSGQVDAAMRDARRSVSEQALPQIAREAAASGNIGSSKRGLAEGVVQRGLAEKTADVSAQLRGNAYNQGLQLSEQGRQFDNNAMLQAMQSRGTLAGNLAQAGLGQTGTGVNTINAGTNAGQLGLGYQNAGMDASKLGLAANDTGMQQQLGLFDLANKAGAGNQVGNQLGIDDARLRAQNPDAWQALQNYYGIVGSQNWGGTGTQTSTQTPSQMSQIGGMMGMAGQGIGMLSMLSDRRAKTGIKPVGKLDNGLTVYSYRYIDGGPTQIGVMAQDVERVKPDAVVEIGGLKHVNYDMAVEP